MKPAALAATAIMVVELAGCSGEHPLSAEKSPVKASKSETTTTIDPYIPALVVSARCMSAAEKHTYDQDRHGLITGLQSARHP